MHVCLNLSPGLIQQTLAADHFFSISGFVLVPCGRLSWFLLAFDRTLISHSYLLTYLLTVCLCVSRVTSLLLMLSGLVTPAGRQPGLTLLQMDPSSPR